MGTNVFRSPDIYDARITFGCRPTELLNARIGRGIVRNNNLKIAVSLRLHRFYGTLQQIGAIITWDAN